MAQFYNYYFSFNGIYSRKYGYKLVTLDDGLESIFGLDININKEKGANNQDIYYGDSSNDMKLTITFAKVDEFNIPMKFTREELKFIANWLFNKKEYLPFECDGLVYYVKFIKGTRWDNGAMRGYITLEMDILNGIAYEPIEEVIQTITNEGYVYINNNSTATDIIYPNYEFIIKTGNEITITNETTGQVVSFNALQTNEKITVDNNIKDMKSSIGLNRNVYSLSNKNWLYLANGDNAIKITCDSCDFKIQYQNKMCLM